MLAIISGTLKLSLVIGGIIGFFAYKTKPTRDSFITFMKEHANKNDNNIVTRGAKSALLNAVDSFTSTFNYKDYVVFSTVEICDPCNNKKRLFVGVANNWMEWMN